jgi:hypothetical protein
VVIELQRDAYHLMARLTQQTGNGAAVHAAGHRNEDAHAA